MVAHGGGYLQGAIDSQAGVLFKPSGVELASEFSILSSGRLASIGTCSSGFSSLCFHMNSSFSGTGHFVLIQYAIEEAAESEGRQVRVLEQKGVKVRECEGERV